MNARFRKLVDALEPKLEALVAMPPVRYDKLPRRIPRCAVYLFSEGGEHLYVGRTSNLRNRLHGHCAPTAVHHSAAFAFRLACETTGIIKASYEPRASHARLPRDPVFEPAFAAARIRVSRMDLRYVEEPDHVMQALLEIYVATALQTRYNGFEPQDLRDR